MGPGTPNAECRRRAWGRRAAYGLALAVALANLPKPLHIDDTLYVRIAEQIVRKPLDPYGFVINWQHVPQPAHQVSVSPPLLSYCFAAVLALGGDAEWALHAAMAPWLLLAAWALLDLGERLGAGPWVALLTLGGPCVAAATNLMLDVPLLAAMSAGMACLLRALEGRGVRWWLLAGLCAAAAPLLKYSGLALALAYLAAGGPRGRRAFVATAFAAAPAALAVGAWQCWSRALYGATQLHEAGGFLAQFQVDLLPKLARRSLIAAAVVAATCPFWMLAWARRPRLLPAACGALAVAAGIACDHDFGGMAAFAAFAAAGLLGIAALAVPAGQRSPGMGWAVAWCVGVAGIALFGAPFVAARYFLPLHPPLLLLALRGQKPARAILVGATAAAWCVGGLVAWAEFRWAGAYRHFAREAAARPPGAPMYFTGHWGWQYYMERAGFRALDYRQRLPERSELFVPLRADSPPAPNGPFIEKGRSEMPAHPLLVSTWSGAHYQPERVGLRFHGSDGWHLPWGWSTAPTERIARFAEP